MFKELLSYVKSGRHLTVDQSKQLMTAILSGEIEESDLINLLQYFDEKAVQSNELFGMLSALKEFCVAFDHEPVAIDTCGTGGSNKTRFNISTCVAFVLAAAGEKVVKHGNYGSISPNGSFNFLESLGIPFLLPPDQLAYILNETKCCFLFARSFHPAMKHVVNARKVFGKRSFFNLLGPLANPANVSYQLIGMPNDDHLELLSNVVRMMGMKKVIFVIGGDGRDEISLAGASKIIEVTALENKEYEFNFEKMIKVSDTTYSCGNSSENAKLLQDILDDKDFNHPVIDHICINAAAGLLTLGKVTDLIEGYHLSKSLFENGNVEAKIKQVRLLSNKLATAG